MKLRSALSKAGLLAGVCGAALAASLTLTGVAMAQSAPLQSSPMSIAVTAAPSDVQVEGVVVTAERRSTSVQNTPIAVSVISPDFLDKGFINEISGLNAIVPSLEITQANGSEQLVSIRGIGSETPENTASTTPGVSEFVDGVYLVNSVSLDETLFDIDHIEVLRGPQGDLFGESSIGGALNLVTKQPELNRFGGSGDFSFGDYDLTRERVQLNLPLGETLAVRASFQKYDHDGFTKDVAIPGYRLDDADDTSGKVAVLWKPTDAFSATLTGQWYHADQNGAAQKNIDEFTPAVNALVPGVSSPREVYQDYPSKFELTDQLYHLNLQWDTPWFSVRSVTGAQYQTFVYQYDSSRSAFSILGAYDDVAAYNTKTASYTEEFDLLSRPGSPLDWDVGAFVLNEETHIFIAEFEGSTANPDTAITPNIETVSPGNLAYGDAARTARQGYAAFGRATYHVTPKLSFTLGARINHDSYTGDSFNFSAYGTSDVSHGYNDTVPTGRVEADYQATSANMIYASVARGYKPGGLNGRYGQAVVPETFNDETNTSFEVGSKNAFLDNQLRVNLAAFYYLYRNMQYIEYDPVPFDSGISNIPSIHEYGLEAEASFQSRDHRLHIDTSFALENGMAQGDYKTINSTIANGIEQTGACYYGYNPACYSQVLASAESIKGKTPPDMPKFSGSLSASYLLDTPYGTLTPRAQYVYRGSEWARIFNVAGLDRIDPYGVTNLNLEFDPTGSRLRLSIAATNVFNVDGVNSRFTDPYGTDQTSQEYIPPRQIIATIAYAF
jgi:iron complex outermembrane receptor protein